MEELVPCLPVQGVHPYFALLSQAKVSDFKSRGLFVVTWTVNQEAIVRELLAWGVDGIIGDLPDQLLVGRR